MSTHQSLVRYLLAAITVSVGLHGCALTQPIGIRTLSNRPDLVSGGDALIEITLPARAPGTGLRVELGERDVTAAFGRRDGRFLGLVNGLALGANRITARADQARAATLTVKNSPGGGPVFSGAQPAPFFCATPVPQAARGDSPATNGSGLGTVAVDAQCTIATEYKLYYRTSAPGCRVALPDPSPSVMSFVEQRQAVPFASTSPPTTATPPANGCFKPYDATGARPSDLAVTTTDQGLTVPYILRVERGTMNRGIYDIAVLYDPTREWSALEPQAQWNSKVLYQLGFGNGQSRRQVRPVIAWTSSDTALARGFMVVANSMTDSLTNSNRVVMAETLMMMKEHVTEQYGAIKFTIGSGGSGGAGNANLSASIAPGLLDGALLIGALPDGETLMTISDCVLLVEAYQKPEWLSLMYGGAYTLDEVNAKKAAINGHLDHTACHSYYGALNSQQAGNYPPRTADNATGKVKAAPVTTNNCELPPGTVYDAVTNPQGVRCDEPSWSASIWGEAPGTSYPRSTRDNVGVQYGLAALQSGALTAEEFVRLNELVGGIDHDGRPAPVRSVADDTALATAYRAGLVSSGRNLARMAVIDLRGWDDAGPFLGIHHTWLSFAIRDRIDQEFGDHGNYVMWRYGRNPPPAPPMFPSAAMERDALLAMDAWLTNVVADKSEAPLEQKVRRARPTAQAFDYCILSSDKTRTVKTTDPAQCDADASLKPLSSPRGVAGAPRAANILKCQLKPLKAEDYAPAQFSAAQWARLVAVFRAGVCDWSKPGVGQQPAASPVSFAAGPGGRSLATPPN